MNRFSSILCICTLFFQIRCIPAKFLHDGLCVDQSVSNFLSEVKDDNNDNYLQNHFQNLENRHLLYEPFGYPRTRWDFRVDCRDSCLNDDGTRWHRDTCQLQLTSNEYFTNSDGDCNTDPNIVHRGKLPSYLWFDYMISVYEFSNRQSWYIRYPYFEYWYYYNLRYFWERPEAYEIHDIYMYYDVRYSITLFQEGIRNGNVIKANLELDKFGSMDKYQRDRSSGSITFTKWFFVPDRVVREFVIVENKFEPTENLFSTITMSYIKDVQIPGVLQAYGLNQEPLILNAMNCTQDNNGCLELYNQFRRQDVTSPGCYCLNVVWNEFILCDHLEQTYYTHTLASNPDCGTWITFLRGYDADHAVRFFNQLEGIVGGIDITIPKECIYESNLFDTANLDEDIVFDIPYSNKIDILKPWKRSLPYGYSATCLRIQLKTFKDKIVKCAILDEEHFLEYEKEELSAGDFDYAAFRYYDNTGKVLPARINKRFLNYYTENKKDGDDWTDDSYTCKGNRFKDFNIAQNQHFCAENPACNKTSMISYDLCIENNWIHEYGRDSYKEKVKDCDSITHYQNVDSNGRRDCLYKSVQPEQQGVYFTGRINGDSELEFSDCTTCVSGEQDYTERACSNVLDARCKCPANQIFGRLSVPINNMSVAQKYVTGHNTSECTSCRTCNPLEGFYQEQSCGHNVVYWNGDDPTEIRISEDYKTAGAGYYTVVQDTQCGTCNQDCKAGEYRECSANSNCKQCSCKFGNLGTKEAYCYVNTTVCDGTGFQEAGAEVKRFDDIVCEVGFYKDLDSLLAIVGSGQHYRFPHTTDRTRNTICEQCELQSTITVEVIHGGSIKYCRGTIQNFKMLNDYFYNESLACNGTSYEVEEQAGCQQCADLPAFASFIEILKCHNQDCSEVDELLNGDKTSCDYECDAGYYRDENGNCISCSVDCPAGQYRPVTECVNNIDKLPDCESCNQVTCSQGQYIVECNGGGKDNSCENCEEVSCNSDQVPERCPGNLKEDTSRCVDCGAQNTNTTQIPADATALTSGGGDACGFQCNAGFYREGDECLLCPTDVLQESCCLDWVADNEGEKIEFCPYALLPGSCSIPGVQHGRPGCVCKAGNYLQEKTCTTCEANKFTETDFNHTTCKSCKRGKYSNAGSLSCTPCPVNKYRENIGMSQCEVCEPGTSNQTGQYDCNTACLSGQKARAKVELGYWVFKTGTSECENVFEIPSSCLINDVQYCETLEEMRWGHDKETCESNSAFEYSSQEPTYTTECVPCESGYAWSGNFNPFDVPPTEDAITGAGVIEEGSDASSGSSDTCSGFWCGTLV